MGRRWRAGRRGAPAVGDAPPGGAGPGSAGAALLAGRRRTLGLVVAIAVGAAATGWAAGRAIESPGELTRDVGALEAAPITVPVELRRLESSVVTRGEVRSAGAVEVVVAAEFGPAGDPVVTGRLPRVGDQLAEGDVAIEVSGRPVLVLAGALPMYRALQPGLSGADVAQLERALARLGHLTRPPGSTYDHQTGAAVARLYQAAGYEPTGPSPDQRQQLDAGREAVRAARLAHRQAQAALDAARQPPPRSAVLAAQGAVAQARFDHDRAVVTRDQAIDSGADPMTIADLEAQVSATGNRLAVAEAQLAELTAAPDLTDQREAVAAAADDLRAAESALAELEAVTGIRVPRGELVFVASLPRQVDEVTARLGGPPPDPVMSLSGTGLRVECVVSRDERDLISVDQPVRLDDEVTGVELSGRVTSVARTAGGGAAGPGQYAVVVTPTGGDPAELAGLNLRVTFPIGATDGEVLAVPLAALVTDAAGVTRVRVDRAGRFEDVTVQLGLTAAGFAEVVPVDGELAAGDLVVVGTR